MDLNIKSAFNDFVEDHEVSKSAYKDFMELAHMALDYDGGVDAFMEHLENDDSYLMSKFGDYDEELIEEWLRCLQESYDDSESYNASSDIDLSDYASGKAMEIPELVSLDGVHRGGMTDRLLSSKKGLYKE